MNDRIHYFQIADHVLKVVDQIGIAIDKALPSFTEFHIKKGDQQPILTIWIRKANKQESPKDRKLLSDISVIWEEKFRFEEDDLFYFTSILGVKDTAPWLMKSSKNFAESYIFPQLDELYATSKLSWLIMVAFGQACLIKDTILVHASVVENSQQAFAFLGKSGTGKSTHSRLWIESFADFKLLNDDNPAIRVMDEKAYIYGTPWSGKTPCYRAVRIPLAGIVRLSQAAKNVFSEINHVKALTALLPSGSAIRWNMTLFNAMISTLEHLVQLCEIAELHCLPNQDAAKLCYNSLKKLQNVKKVI